MIKRGTYQAGMVHIIYDKQASLTRALCRFQEHYENPEFKGKVFTLGQFRQYYAKTHGKWSYYTDWSGFNMPSSNLEQFLNGMFDPLSAEEDEFLTAIEHMLRLDHASPLKPFYIIATSEDCDRSIVPHEQLHSLYYTNKRYKREIDGFMRKHLSSTMPVVRRIFRHFEKLGYHTSVWRDELQAYLGSSMNYLEGEVQLTEELRWIAAGIQEVQAKYTGVFQEDHLEEA